MGDRYTYHCPVRGNFDSVQREQEFVIECLHWLIEKKGVPAEHIGVDQILFRFGARGHNSIRPDILVFRCPVGDAKDSNGNFLADKVALVAEIKIKSKDKDSAIEHQIHPVIEMCESIVGGIYWDEALRVFIDKNKQEHSIVSLPDEFMSGKSGGMTICQEMLMPLKRGERIWDVLAEALRTNQGASRGQVYEELFKVLVSKYFDEAKNHPLKFGVFNDSPGKVFRRINSLYRQANKTYKLQDAFADMAHDGIALNERTLCACVKILEPYTLKRTDMAIIQEFYMKFAPAFLKQDLKQYYTPKEVVSFMTESVRVKKDTQAIDPCCGTGDFMVGVLRKAHRMGIGPDVGEGLFCWDINDTAVRLAKVNMILNGDGRTNVRVINSLDERGRGNGNHDFVITNPPFGKDSTYDGGGGAWPIRTGAGRNRRDGKAVCRAVPEPAGQPRRSDHHCADGIPEQPQG